MIIDEPEYDIRYSEPADENALKTWLADPAIRREFPIQTDAELAAFIPNWIGFHRFKSSITATYKGQTVGIATLLLMPYKKLIHHCLCYLVVDPKWQKKGVGTSLVRNLKHLAKDYFNFEFFYAEFYEGCPITSILEKQDFTQTLRQERYVKEDNTYRARIVMEVNL